MGKKRDELTYIGNIINGIEILEKVSNISNYTGIMVRARCSCKTEFITHLNSIESGRTKSCGCKVNYKIEIKGMGETFGKLTIISDTGKRASDREPIIIARCICGNEFETGARSVRDGITLCYNCHANFHRVYGRLHNSRARINQFLGIRYW